MTVAETDTGYVRAGASRRAVLGALATAAGVAGSGLMSGRAFADSGGLDVATLQPADLTFSPAATMVPYAIVSPGLRTLDDDFRSESPHRYRLLGPDPALAAPHVTVRGGALRAEGSAPFFTLVCSDTAQDAPYSGVIADVQELSGGTGENTVLVGLVRDSAHYLMGWYDHAAGTAGIEVATDGGVRTPATKTVKLEPPFRLAFTLTGPGAAVLADEGDGWRVLAGAEVAGEVDLRGIGPSAANTTFDTPVKVPAGGTLGQVFTVDKPFVSVGGMFPTYQTTDAAVTLTLYREGPGGSPVTSSRLTGVPDDAWQFLTVDTPLPAGTYYLEQSQPSGSIAWWSNSTDVIDWGQAYENGRPVEGDRTVRVMFPATETGPQLLASYRNAVGVRADGGTVALGRLEAGYFGQAGVRDPAIVTTPDGAPYISGGDLYLTLTNSGPTGGIPAGHMGIFRMPLDDYEAMEEVGKIFTSRDSLVLGDHAGRVVYDPAAGGFRVVSVTFGDYDIRNNGRTQYSETGAGVLHGVHVLPARPLVLGIDPYPVRIDGTWWLAVSDSGRTTLYRFTDDAFRRPVLAAVNDNGGVYYEGTKMCRVGPHWYILTSSATDYRVYDLRARLVGTLDAPHPDGYIPHPMVLPVPLTRNRTRFLHLSMDGAGDPVSGAFGHFLVNTGDQIVQGREFRTH